MSSLVYKVFEPILKWEKRKGRSWNKKIRFGFLIGMQNNYQKSCYAEYEIIFKISHL